MARSTTAYLIAPLFAGVADAVSPAPAATISRDVMIVGGGAAGAHAAVWLRDAGKSVVVIERASQLGGHTAVYTDPVTGKVINVGIQTWVEYEDTFNFPARLNVSTSGSMSFTPNSNVFVDMKTGKRVADFTAPADAEKNQALQRYLDALLKYEDLVLPGFDKFPANGSSIPDDLLMPFSDFVEKYDLHAAVPQIWDATAQGLGDTMNTPTLWVMQASAAPMARALLGQAAAAVPASGRLYDLYDAVARFLGPADVLYSSTVVSSKRTEKSVSLEVRSADGKTTTEINAKRLLLAIQPTPENLAPFDLSATETEVLSKFSFATVYAGILRHPSLQSLTAYTNRSPSTHRSNNTILPVAPQVGRIDYIGGSKDLYALTAVGTSTDTEASMKALIASSIDAMISSGTIPAAANSTNGTGLLTFGAFANHGKMHPHVSADEIRAGFVVKLRNLQGLRSTFWTGAAFSAGFSTVLWEYNERLLPRVVEGL